MSTKKYIAPKTDGVIGMSQNGPINLDQRWREFLAGGLEDVSGRVAASVDGDTATVADVVTALKNAGLMKSG